MDNVYEIPLILEEAGLGEIVMDALDLRGYTQDLSEWAAMVDRMKNLGEVTPIALVGKYVEYPDSYLSVREALRHAGLVHGRDIEIQWVHSEDVEREGADALLATACGIVVPGGFGPRGVEGMVQTVRYAREHQVPYLGLVPGLAGNGHRLGPRRPGPAGRQLLRTRPRHGGPRGPHHGRPALGVGQGRHHAARLLSLPAPGRHLDHGRLRRLLVSERHRHRYELNNDYREAMGNSGFIVGGLSPDGSLVETGEVREHPFMVGVQFHPEFKSRPNRPHPLFTEFIGAAKKTIREGVQRPLPLGLNGGA